MDEDNERIYFVAIGRGAAPVAFTAVSALEAVFKAVVHAGVRVEIGTLLSDGKIETKEVAL